MTLPEFWSSARELGLSFEEVVNRTLRAYLGEQPRPQGRSVPKVTPHSFGFQPGIDLDKLNQLVDELESESYATGVSI